MPRLVSASPGLAPALASTGILIGFAALAAYRLPSPTPWLVTILLTPGSSIGDILLAGSWRSGAFLRYLRRSEVDMRASVDAGPADAGVLEAVFDQSGSDA